MIKPDKNNVIPHELLRWFALIAFSALTLAFHYGFFQLNLNTGDLFRRLCYLPILLGAFWFGVTGGLGMAGAISIALVPHTMRVASMGGDLGGEIVETVFYISLGGIFGLLVDRERKQEKARFETERKLARAEHLSTIGEMASHLAHEIKNPLGSIRGAAEIIIPDIPDEGLKKEFGDILLQEVDRLNRVVENFLKYARPLKLKRENVKIGALLDDVAKQLGLAAGKKDIKVDVICPDDSTVYMDEAKLRQVFLNMGLNAIRSMPEGGRLTFEVLGQGTEGTMVSVEDTGKGIAPENLKKIFDPFFTTSDDGSGLGLAICEKIIIEHGGNIVVHSQPGKGSTFIINLPAGDVGTGDMR